MDEFSGVFILDFLEFCDDFDDDDEGSAKFLFSCELTLRTKESILAFNLESKIGFLSSEKIYNFHKLYLGIQNNYIKKAALIKKIVKFF